MLAEWFRANYDFLSQSLNFLFVMGILDPRTDLDPLCHGTYSNGTCPIRPAFGNTSPYAGTLLHDPNLWHLNRHSVARAMAVGLFAAFIPIPLQMLLAAFLAISVRGNMPIAVSLVWLTNPITMPVVFFCTYMTGTWLMNIPAPAPCPMN